MSTWFRRAVVAVTAGLLLSGCASGSGASGGQSTSQETVSIGMTSGISQLDPTLTSYTAEKIVWSLLWDGLTEVTEDGDVEPDLASSWTTSEDGLTWTFTLRDGVTFHDGSAFTAADAAYTINRVLDPSVDSPQRSRIQAVTSATAASDNTLVLTLSTVMPQLPAALVDIKILDDANTDVASNPNGTGPYRVVDFVPDQEVTLEANPDYWAGAPETSTITVTKYPDTTSAQSALESGTLTALWGAPFDQISTLGDSGLTVIQPKDSAQAAVWELDNSSWPFNDVRARQALSYATDRETIQQVAYGDLGDVNSTGTLINPNSDYVSPDSAEYDYDLDRAKELFAEAGVNSGDTLTCWTTAGIYPEWTSSCQVLQSSLAQIGISLDIQTNESSTWAESFFPAGKSYPGLIVADQISREAPPLPFVLGYFGQDGWSPTNWAGTAEYEQAKATAYQTDDPDQATAAFQDGQRILSEELPLVSIINVSVPLVVQSDLQGVWISTNGIVHLESISR